MTARLQITAIFLPLTKVTARWALNYHKFLLRRMLGLEAKEVSEARLSGKCRPVFKDHRQPHTSPINNRSNRSLNAERFNVPRFSLGLLWSILRQRKHGGTEIR